MLLVLMLSALALGKPTVTTRGTLPVGPLLAWTVEGEGRNEAWIRGAYEPAARDVSVVRSSEPIAVVGRDGRNVLLVAEGADEPKVWRVDARSGAVAAWTGDPPGTGAEARPLCGDRWPPISAGSHSLFFDPEITDHKVITSAKAIGFHAHTPTRYAHNGKEVRHHVAGLAAVMGDTHFEVFLGQDELLWEVGPDGTARRAATLGDEDLAVISSVAPSPDRSMLAIGAADRQRWTTRRLVVVDRATGSTLMEIDDIDVSTSRPLDLAVLETVWVGNDALRYSTTLPGKGMHWVEVAVPTGEQVWTRQYSSKVGSRHRPPPGGHCIGVEVADGAVRIVDSQAMVLAGGFTPEDCAWSANGRLAACSDQEKLWLVDGDTGQTSSVHKGHAIGLRWLP